jgi:hypothetical protein
MSTAQFRHNRRDFLSRSALGLGAAAASTLLHPGLQAADSGVLGAPHFAPRAKRVIYLFMSGGPSHIDLFDHKPRLQEEHGKELPNSIRGTQRVTLMTRSQSKFPCFGSPFKFAQHGQSGHWFSELLPHMASTADEWTMLKAVQTEPINHDPAMMFIQTGRGVPGRPAFGCWLHYGLGAESADLPAYIVMTSGNPGQPILSRYWHSGFLPSKYQGVQFQSTGDPVLFLSNPRGIDHDSRGRVIGLANRLNTLKHEQVGDPEIEARIDAFQMAYRMQVSVPELTDFADEPKSVLDLYGPDAAQQGSFAYQCLLARRLAERGVRFVQLFNGGWDHHGGLEGNIKRKAKDVDQASAGLIKDLKLRGMLDDTLVIWGGEFGRTAYTQGSNGRDHHPRCFTKLVAGGGFKPGVAIGETDAYGYNILRDRVHVRDLHATLLHCLGIDHQRLTFRFQGLDAKLTGIEPAKVRRELLA